MKNATKQTGKYAKQLAVMLIMISTPGWGENRSASMFVQVEKLSTKLRDQMAPTIGASFHFRLNSGVDCTGTFISDTGHFLTARHCVAGCLMHHHAVEKELAVQDFVGQIPTLDLFHGQPTYKMTIAEEMLDDDGLDCPGTINGAQADVHLIMTGGRGWLAPSGSLASFSKEFPDEYRELLDEGYEHSGDFAILRAINIRPSSCLRLGAQSPHAGEKLHAVSFPCLSRLDIETGGTTALFTQGIRTSGFKQSQYYKELGPKKIAFDIESVERKETFFSTLDMERCGSGTAIVNSDFQIVGVATRVYKSSTQYEIGSVEAVDVAQITKELRERKAPDFKDITACSAASALPSMATPATSATISVPPPVKLPVGNKVQVSRAKFQ